MYPADVKSSTEATNAEAHNRTGVTAKFDGAVPVASFPARELYKEAECEKAENVSISAVCELVSYPVFSSELRFYHSQHENYLLHLDDDPYSLASFFTQYSRMGGVYWALSSLWLLGSGSGSVHSAASSAALSTIPSDASHDGVTLGSGSTIAMHSQSCSAALDLSDVHHRRAAHVSSPELLRKSSAPVLRATDDKQYTVERPCFSTGQSEQQHTPLTLTRSKIQQSGSQSGSYSASRCRQKNKVEQEQNHVTAGHQRGSASPPKGNGKKIVSQPYTSEAITAKNRAATLHRTVVLLEESLSDWILSCQHPDGGFGQGPGQDPHITSTHYALLVLVGLNKLDRINTEKVADWLLSLRLETGGFSGDTWGEADTRFAYCGVAALTLLNKLDRSTAQATAQYVHRCRNADGGYAWVPGGESHAASAFCCVAALALCEQLFYVNRQQLAAWLLERQLPSGGFNGRPEKAPDVCYSFWILAALAIIGYMEWVDKEGLTKYILCAQDELHGGVADKPGDVSDVFHTYFGIAALSLMQTIPRIEKVHPVLSIPCSVTERAKLPRCVLWG